MSRLLTAAIALMLTASVLPLASAQKADAPHLSPVVRTLYAHQGYAEYGTGLDHFMNALRDDGGGDDPGGPWGMEGSFTWTMELRPALERTVALDPDGQVVFTVYLGASLAMGNVSVEVELTHGGERVAAGAAKDHEYTPSLGLGGTSAVYPSINWAVPVEMTELEPGLSLVWTVYIEGLSPLIYLGMSETRGHSNLILPVIPEGPGKTAESPLVIFADEFASDHAHLSLAADSAMSGPLHRKWESGLANATARFRGDVTNGTVAVTLRDSATTLAGLTLSGRVDQTVEISGALPGSWTLDLLFTDFTGNLAMTIQPVPDDDSTNPEDEGHDPDHDKDQGFDQGQDYDHDQDHEDDHEHDDEEGGARGIPTAGLGVLLVGLGAVAALRRRD